MDSDAEGVPSEFFDYFKVGLKFLPGLEFMSKCIEMVCPLTFRLVFRFYAFKDSLHAESMRNELSFLLKCCR